MAYIDPNGNVYVDDGNGGLQYVPDVDTANALGIDWNDLTPIDSPGGNTSGTVQSVDTSSSSAQPQQSQPTSGFDFDPYAGQDVIDPSSNVYRYDGSSGTWKHIPDVVTANAIGVNWNALVSVPGQPQPFGGEWPEYVASVAPPPVAVATKPAAPSSAPPFISEHGAGQGTPAPGAINVNEQAAALGIAPLVPVAAAPINPVVVQQEAAAYNNVPAVVDDVTYDDGERSLLSVQSQLKNIQPGSGGWDFNLPDSLGGNPSAKVAWKSLMTTMAEDVIPALRSSNNFHTRIRQKIG